MASELYVWLREILAGAVGSVLADELRSRRTLLPSHERANNPALGTLSEKAKRIENAIRVFLTPKPKTIVVCGTRIHKAFIIMGAAIGFCVLVWMAAHFMPPPK